MGASPWVRGQSKSFSLGLEGRFELPTTLGDTANQARSSLAGAVLVPCVHSGIWSTCPLLVLGRYDAEGVDLPVSRSVSALFIGSGLRAGFELAVARYVFAYAQLEALANLTRHSLQISGQLAWQVPVFGVAMSFGASASIL